MLSSVKVGNEISYTRYFCQPQPLQSLKEIRADIIAFEQETAGLLAGIVESEASPSERQGV